MLQINICQISYTAFFIYKTKQIKYQSCMRSKEHKFDSMIKHSRFCTSFELCLYLHQFFSISLAKQGFYYITATLCPKMAVLKPTQNGQNTSAKTYSSHVFHIKYNNHIEILNEFATFNFYLEQTIPASAHNNNKNKLLFVFQLYKCVNEFSEQPQRKMIEEYEVISQFSFEIVTNEQLSFIQYFDAKFQLPYAAQINGIAICLMTNFSVSDDDKLIKSEHELIQANKIEKVKNYFTMMSSLKKISKKHRFTSYTVQKSIQDTFLGFKSVMSIPIPSLSPPKSYKQMDSVITYPEQSIYPDSRPESPQKYHYNCKKSQQLISSCNLQEKLSSLNEKQCSQEQFLNYLAYAQFQDKKIEHILDELKKLGQRNRQVIQQLSSCLNPQIQENRNSMLHKIHIEGLAQEYQRKKNILYGQKTSFFGQSLASSAEQMKQYAKNIQSLKSKQKDLNNFFTKMNKIFNLVPDTHCQLESLKFDKCPFIFYSYSRYDYISSSSQEQQNQQKIQQQENKMKIPSEQSQLINIHKQKSKQSQFKNVFILAHGYQASGANMQRLKISMKKIFSKSKFLVLKSFSQHMDRSLEQMGAKAAKQIEGYINNLTETSTKKIRIIFVGHSMGGLILRASINHLSKRIRQYFHTYISFATPHLGYLHSKSLVTGAGIKLIQSMHSSTSLKQLSNKDKSNIKQTYIYKLAKVGSLKQFSNVIVFSSIEDKYVPWNSARIQLYKQPEGIAGKNTTGGWSMNSQKHYLRFVEQEMINQILGIGNKNSKLNYIHRFQVDFNICHVSLDTMIGRTSHVAFLGNQHLISMVFEHCLRKTLLNQLKHN